MIKVNLLLILYFVGLSVSKHNIEQLTKPVALGEGLHWDADKQLLYFVDITNCRINCFNPETNEHTSTHIEGNGKVGFIFPIKDRSNNYVVSTGQEIRLIEWDGQQDSKPTLSKVITKSLQEDGSRFNDAKVDNNGILWAGTMGPEPVPTVVKRVNSKLYTYNFNDNKLIPRIENVYISNGLDWTRDNKYMYWTDTGENKIERFNYDLNDPNIISNRTVIYDFNKNQIKGKTDGLTIDTEGNLYLACYGGYQVIVVNPNSKEIIDTIEVPAMEVTTVTFGGPDLNDLYIASSQKGSNEQNLRSFPKTGSIFRIKNYRAKGYPGNPVPNAKIFDELTQC